MSGEAFVPSSARLSPRVLSANNTVIESLGVYLPERVVDTDRILQDCRKRVSFPLKQTTGIRSRHVAADGEYAIDLAAKAVGRCLEGSRRDAAAIDLLICCNISRFDGPDQIACEPGTAAKLAGRLGLSPARMLDLSNACAGFFTGIAIADAYLRTGAARLAMVVSGEHITHLTKTAQREISGFFDERLACLTLGDAGAAVLLEEGSDRVSGLHEIELYTLGAFSRACIAHASDRAGGGAIMLTDVVKLSGAAIAEASEHAVAVQKRAGWAPELLQHLIMHQTSERTIQEAATHVDRLYGRPVSAGWNVASSVGRRGNTATTSHFVAFQDGVADGRIREGDNVLFSVNGSGLTIGTAVYKCDDLPSRMRKGTARSSDFEGKEAEPPLSPALRSGAMSAMAWRPAIELESVTVLEPNQPAGMETLDLACIAAESCLERSRFDRTDIDLLIYVGIYRTRFVAEPAIAALIAGLVGVNHEKSSTRRTLCFDVLNGAAGFLTACDVVATMLAAGRGRNALIVASEIENNCANGGPRLGLEPTASAVILTADKPEGETGLADVSYAHYPHLMDRFSAYCDLATPGGRLVFERSADFEERAIDCLVMAMEAHRREGGPEPDFVLAPQISAAFLSKLEQRLGHACPIVDATKGHRDLYTSSLPQALRAARPLCRRGSVGMLMEVAAGMQVARAAYRF